MPAIEPEESGRSDALRLLVAEDDGALRAILEQVLISDGHEVTAVGSGEEALEAFWRDPFPVVLTDAVMGRLSGMDLLREVKGIAPETEVIVMIGQDSPASWVQALRAGAFDCLTKPFAESEMISAVVNRAAEKIRLAGENRCLLADLRRQSEELESLNAALQDMANRDGLTGLYNHRYFREALDREIARARRHDRVFSIVMLDIDRFKAYNEAHGRLAGDDVLGQIAALLKRVCRASNIVARYGGEEFVVLVAEADQPAALALARKLWSATRQARVASGAGDPSETLTVSAGVATFGPDGTNAAALLDAASMALYRAKQAGGDRVAAATFCTDLTPVE